MLITTTRFIRWDSSAILNEVFVILTLLALLTPTLLLARNLPPPISTIKMDDYWHYTNVGAIGLTITNFGVLGQGYRIEGQPSCMYKIPPALEMEQVEHISYAGLWVGGKVGGVKRVSTGIVDGVFEFGEAGFEYTNTASTADTLQIRSSFLTSPVFSPNAISHQDFLCDFTDTNTVVPGTIPPVEIPDHTPLGIGVHLETYAWNYSFADAFVILNLQITNVTAHLIEDLYVGYWADVSVGNMNYTNIYVPGGGWNWYDNLNGFDQEHQMAYSYDANGDDGWAESYVGIRFLGSNPHPSDWDVYYNEWQWNRSSSFEYPDFVMPINDMERYDKMSTQGNLAAIPSDPVNDVGSWMILITAGPLGDLPPDSSINVVWAVVCGRWAPGEGDSPERRANLTLNSNWALIAYHGEDSNGDGILEPEEDTNHDGILNRYILPAPPPSPQLHVEPGDRQVTLYWDNSPESAIDPITRQQDFEGYRIYSSRKTAGIQGGYTLLAQFDLQDNIGYNTGLQPITLPEPITIDGVTYQYRFVNEGVLNGWPSGNAFAVTAFDQGDPQNNLESLESSITENLTYTYPGTPTASEAGKVYVYPNPYKVAAAWDGSGDRERLLWFANLPARCTIKIYTLAGDLVKTLNHDAATYNGSNVERLSTGFGNAQRALPGGEHAWDLISQYDQAIATGLYLFTVKDDRGNTQVGKFLVIK
jgi:hypothetical protein